MSRTIATPALAHRRRIDSIMRAFSSGEPPASRDVGARLSPSEAASTVRRSTPSGLTSYRTPVPSRGSSSTPAPWTTNARSVPSSRSTSATRGHRRVADAATWRRVPAGVGHRAEQVERRPARRSRGGSGPRGAWPGGSSVQTGTRSRRAERGGRRIVGIVVDREFQAPRGRRCPNRLGRRDRPVAVLGDRHAGRSHDEGRRGRDVEACRVPSPSSRLRRRSPLPGASTADSRSHRRREAGQFLDRLAAHPQAH